MNWDTTALMFLDMQNDFLHADGAYARGGATSDHLAVLPARLEPLADHVRKKGGWIVSTHFTLIPGKGGDPFISDHLKKLRPFLGKGDFAPGSWGHALLDDLAPADLSVDKVAYSAFYMSRLEWALRTAGIKHIIGAGIVTNGGVTSTMRDAHVHGYESTVLEDGCAAFDTQVHKTSIDALRSVASIATISDILKE